MDDQIIINGKAVTTHDQASDASSSDHIIIRTTGLPLNKAQKHDLAALGVKIHEFVGNETQQIYLCLYKKTSLEEIRALEFVDFADVYAKDFVVPDVMKVKKGHDTNTDEGGAVYATAAAGHSEMVEVDVLLHKDVGEVSKGLINQLCEAANVNKSAIAIDAGIVRIKVEKEALEKLAELDEVRVIHPVNERAVFNNVARHIMESDVSVSKSSTIYKGDKQMVCVCDTGFDTGSTTDTHDGFTGRVELLSSWGRRTKDKATDDPDGHGTHVCGSLLGAGDHTTEGHIEGTAPLATLMVQSLFVRTNYLNQPVLGGYPKDLGQLFDEAYQAGARIHTNSWGTPLPLDNVQKPYDTSAENIDQFVWDHQDMTILFAAGNDGQDQDLDGKVNERSLGAEASAKNCITVGATENYRPQLASGKTASAYTYGAFWPNKFTKNPLKDDHQANNPEGLAAFSSRGPTAENRLKPDVVAPGTAILSTRSRKKKASSAIDKMGVSGDDRYMYLSGTSMATPLVAGSCAAIREALLKNGYKDEIESTEGIALGKNPTGSLVKALLVNGAQAIKGQYMPDDIGNEPNPHSGFGRVHVSNCIAMVEGNDGLGGYGVGVIEEETEEAFTTRISLPKSSSSSSSSSAEASGNAANGTNNESNGSNGKSTTKWTLKVTLTYADLPGAALSNDLNLLLIVSTKERHGNQVGADFDIGSTEGFDRSNNVEQIIWPDIAGATGDDVQIVVRHYRLLSERVPFAYAWRFYEG